MVLFAARRLSLAQNAVPQKFLPLAEQSPFINGGNAHAKIVGTTGAADFYDIISELRLNAIR